MAQLVPPSTGAAGHSDPVVTLNRDERQVDPHAVGHHQRAPSGGFQIANNGAGTMANQWPSSARRVSTTNRSRPPATTSVRWRFEIPPGEQRSRLRHPVLPRFAASRRRAVLPLDGPGPEQPAVARQPLNGEPVHGVPRRRMDHGPGADVDGQDRGLDRWTSGTSANAARADPPPAPRDLATEAGEDD